MTEYFYGNNFIFGDNKPSTQKVKLTPTLTAEFEIKGPVNFTNTGVGTTILINGEDFENSISLTALSDVDTNSLQNNDTLTYNSTEQTFVNTALKLTNLSDINVTSIQNEDTILYNSSTQKYVNTPFKLENLSDVETLSVQDNDTYVYNSGSQKYVNVPYKLDSLSDVNFTSLLNNDTLIYSTGSEKFANVQFKLTNLSDVDTTGLTNYDTVVYNSTSQKFENIPLKLESLEDFDVRIPGYVVGDLVRYDGTKWENFPFKMTNIKDVDITSIQNNDILRYDDVTEMYINDGIINNSYLMLQSAKPDFTTPVEKNVLIIDANEQIDNRPLLMSDISNLTIDTGITSSVITSNDNGATFENIDISDIGLPTGVNGDTLIVESDAWTATNFADKVIDVITTSVTADLLTDVSYTTEPFTNNTALVWNTIGGAWVNTELDLTTSGAIKTVNDIADTNAPICFVNLSGNQDSQEIKTNSGLYGNLSTGSLNATSLILTNNISATSASFSSGITATSAGFSSNIRSDADLAGDLYTQIKNTNTSTGSSSIVAKVNPTSTGDPKFKLSVDGVNEYDHYIDNSASDTYTEQYNSNISRQVDSVGRNFYPNQVCFLAHLSSNVTNVTGDGTQYVIVFNSAPVNRGTSYNTGTGIFTAPVTGLYSFNLRAFMSQIDAAHTVCTIRLGGSVDHVLSSINGSTRDANNNLCLSNSTILSLTAGNTVSGIAQCYNGTKVIDILGDATIRYSVFQAYFLG